MTWRFRLQRLPAALVTVLLVWLSCQGSAQSALASSAKAARRQELRRLTRQAWQHAYDGYKAHAFPLDELLPLSCRGQGHDRDNPDNTAVNDVMGDFALTLVDSLDTFAVFGDRAGFEQAVRETIEHVSFDVDSRVQVFEVTIRQLGGLLSGHLLASSPKRGFMLPWYRGELLNLAHDLGRRLLPAFDTPTGLPYARVHLQDGLLPGENTETCSAGAGSLVLEFVTLSRLTGDPVFEDVARRAFFAVWNRKSDLNLIGNTINVADGRWLHAISSTGAGIDSFFEYAAKAYVLLGEDEWLRVWDDAYKAIMQHVQSADGFWYRAANMNNGQHASTLVDSLSAFFPGVQVLMGDVEAAIKGHAVFAWQWRRYRALPELFDVNRRQAVSLGYPLRPEFIESNMYLYHATKDDFYLDVAEQVLYDLTNRTTTECGMAALLDVTTGELEDKMPSFLTSETLKYLYMTFAEPDDPWVQDDSNMVFTTEGHMLELPRELLKRQKRPRKRRKPAPICEAYDPFESPVSMHSMSVSVASRTDMELARFLTGYAIVNERPEIDSGRWSEYGWCDMPSNEAYSEIEILFGMSTQQEDAKPSKRKVTQSNDGTVQVKQIAGLRFALSRLWDATDAFVVSRVGPYRVPPGAHVKIEDPVVVSSVKPRRPSHVELRFVTRDPHRTAGTDASAARANANETADEFVVSSTLASFGPINVKADTADGLLRVSMPPFGTGCEATGSSSSSTKDDERIELAHENEALVVHRGGCTFLDKSTNAKARGYSAVIVVNGHAQEAITPSAAGEETVNDGSARVDASGEEGAAALVPLYLVDHATGEKLEGLGAHGQRAKVKVEQNQHGAVMLGGYLVLNTRIGSSSRS